VKVQSTNPYSSTSSTAAEREDLDRKVRQFSCRHSSDGVTASLLRLADLELLAGEAECGGSRVPEAQIELRGGLT